MILSSNPKSGYLFNGPIETGLRSLVILTEAYPSKCSLQRLIIFDYFCIHSDDLQAGPEGLHPKTPYRGGEILVRRQTLQEGLSFYIEHGLITFDCASDGFFYIASEHAESFLKMLTAPYTIMLMQRAKWVVEHFCVMSDSELQNFAQQHIENWGAEFEMQSVLWEDAE